MYDALRSRCFLYLDAVFTMRLRTTESEAFSVLHGITLAGVIISVTDSQSPDIGHRAHHVDCVHLSLSGAIALLGGRCSSSDVVYMKVTSALEDSDHRRFTFEHAVHFLGTRALCSLAHLAIARVCLTNGFQSALICTYQDDLLEGEFPK